ncbi:MAG: 2-C-methyl-D-erythritol 2,4-cyclodiphosphate synthase [Gammaproteobacteria bacterium]|nr:2-C-methyl-D-erythritol 2,4-cyclodiphosphate synthase [Gammaproteobacteria bacterium]
MRIGHGFDVHRFVAGRPLVLGGVTVPHTQGLDGHSDADVVLHALCDALLGAAGLGDLGRHFPDSDPEYAGIDSRKLLRQVASLLGAAGHDVHNVDITIVAEAPRLAPHTEAMQKNIAADIGAGGRVNVKATTSEGLGFTGRGEGIAAWAVVLLSDEAP